MPVSRLPLDMIKIEDEGVHISTTIRINGREARMLIDTGASRTVFDVRKIMSLVESTQEFKEMEQLSSGLGTNSMKSQTTVLAEVEMDKIRLKDLEVVVIDMEHVNTTYEHLGLPQLDGVIGGDLLLRFRASINYSRSELVLRP